jgi:hypothetical protein
MILADAGHGPGLWFAGWPAFQGGMMSHGPVSLEPDEFQDG